jgi:hypothetical protein
MNQKELKKKEKERKREKNRKNSEKRKNEHEKGKLKKEEKQSYNKSFITFDRPFYIAFSPPTQ